MGIDTRRAPPLPAPTETDTTTPTELTSDLSRPGDEKSTYSLPDDGTPVTIRTRTHRAKRSQTSLLIEYFEGGKSTTSGASRKPSVRVRLTPSKKGKGDHIQVTETKANRRPSVSKRIPPGEIEFPAEVEDANSITSYASATEESSVSRNPIDIEIDRSHRRRRPASPLIPDEGRESYVPGSEISAIPTDSFLDGANPAVDLKRGLSPDRAESLAPSTMGGSVLDEVDYRAGKDRGAAKHRPKTSEVSREKSESRKRRSKSRASSISEPPAEDPHGSRRRSSRSHPPETQASAVDSSVVSSSTAPGHRSMDTRSMRSGVSKSSINNPKLLETVEDAIRRLILPELSALKREQSQREGRRESIASTGTSISRDPSAERRRSAAIRNDPPPKEIERPKERRNREARHDYDDLSVHSASLDSMVEGDYATHDPERTPKKSSIAARLAATAPSPPAPRAPSSIADDLSEVSEQKQRERRRKRTEAARSRAQGHQQALYADEYDDEEPAPTPPMPLMSEINPSEMTRTSILSVESEGPRSATEELSPAIEKGTLGSSLSADPVDFQRSLGTSHANVSHGDLTALPRGKKEYAGAQEYESDEYGQKIPVGHYGGYEENTREVADDYQDEYDDPYYSQQDVPPPLKYVPYQAGTRGLSPIPSVSGYTEAESEAPLPTHTRSVNSGSEAYSPVKSPEYYRQSQHNRSVQSLDSASNLQGPEYDAQSSQGKRGSVYSEDTRNSQTAAGKPVRGIGANVRIVNPPFGAESAVASLIDGSMLDQSVLTAASGYDYANVRASNLSYDDRSGVSRNTRSEKAAAVHETEEEYEELEGPAHSEAARSVATSRGYPEYELDEHGRKVAVGSNVTYRDSPTSSEAAITAGAVGAAAAALRAAQEKKRATVEEAAEEEEEEEEEEEDEDEEDFEPAGVNRNKSFKERALDGWQPRNTPAHSMDRLDYEPSKMSSSGVPDMNHPMPEVGYLEDDVQTNPSFVQDQLDEDEVPGQWSGKATPTEYGQVLPKEDEGKDSGLEMTGSADVAGSAATGQSRAPSRDHDEWQRTSEDRKRDTLLTNPYEDASPIVNPALNESLLTGRGIGGGYQAPYHTGSPGFMKYDEGYMSNGPNRTPDLDPKGKAIHMPGGMNMGSGSGDPHFMSGAPIRQLSGMSQGMPSPFFDASTGAGIERIENKDIVALMQHLMVRDAQRSARDTEIVALLMNAALEMRNSFREMKELVQDTSDDIIYAGVENTEKLHKAINGPRPYPGTNSRSLQGSSIAPTIEDVNVKKKNIWKRALQGLSARGTSDLSRIEDMLIQLLGEVDVLKTQTAPPGSTSGQGQSFDNLQADMQYEQDKGYEPEGNSTISHASQSGHLNLGQGQGRQGHERSYSDNRISTVPENDEEYEYDHPTPSAERTNARMMSPSLHDQMIQRGGSAPPPELAAASAAADPNSEPPLSAGNTPKSDKGRKHKSSGSGSSWFPKISRWSGTTASSVGKALRGGKSKDAKYEDLPPSRSGSSMASHEEYQQYSYGDDDKSPSGYGEQQMGEAAIPAIPSYMMPEDPKYKAHRNSLNLQHPQPRTGPTDRYRTALEHSAQEYDVPGTPRSVEWNGSVSSLHRLQTNVGGESSRVSQGGEYWEESSPQQGGPPKPPKEPLERSASQSPPKPQRMSSVQKEPPSGVLDNGYGSGAGTYASQSTAPTSRVTNKNLNNALGVPARRPSGPRAMTPKNDEDAARERRRKRDTFGNIASQDSSSP